MKLTVKVILPDSELQSVDFAESLLVRKCRNVLPETVKGVINALHPPPLPHVGRVPHLHLLPDLNIQYSSKYFSLIVSSGRGLRAEYRVLPGGEESSS